MKKYSVLSMLLGAWLGLGCAGSGINLEDVAKAGQVLAGQSGPLSANEITAGLKEALSKGSSTVVSQLGAKDGFNKDPQIRVPLPRTLLKARDFAKKSRFGWLFQRSGDAIESCCGECHS